MVESEVVSLVTNLTAAGVTASATGSVTKAQEILRRRRYSDEIEDVATVFLEELETAIERENAQRSSRALEGVTDNWREVVLELAETPVEGGRERNIEQIDLIFQEEEEAIDRLAQAIAQAAGYSLENVPEMEQALKTALTSAYREAIVRFEQELAGTDLADVFLTEMDLEIRTEVQRLQTRLTELAADIESLLSQPAKNEGFVQLTSNYYEVGPPPRPERSWRIGFTFSDVRAGIPAERLGRHGNQAASEELLALLAEKEDCLIVGGPGSGKSTLCKQTAVRWERDERLGPVLYRESGSGGGSDFESVEALKQAITETDTHSLVVVEDAIRTEANAIFEVIESLAQYDQVSFLLDSREAELEGFSASGLESSLQRRYMDIVNSLHRYHIPHLSVDDIQRVIDAFGEATDREIDRSATDLRAQLNTRSETGIGEMVLLSYLLPISSAESGPSGLERNVRVRYETLVPQSETEIRSSPRVDDDLVADIGVAVALLTASGVGNYPELIHTLASEYGDQPRTHDDIADVRSWLEGWFLYVSAEDSEEGIVRTTHRLWSILYLRELAMDHEERQEQTRRRSRSERRFARVLECLFDLFDDQKFRESIEREFRESPMIDRIKEDPDETLEEFVGALFGLAESWPALASLFGTTDTARYQFPESCPKSAKLSAVEARGHAHRLRGKYTAAQREYETVLELADDDRPLYKARAQNHLGLVAEATGEFAIAKQRFEEGLAQFRDAGESRGEAMCLSNLGIIARKQGKLTQAEQYHKRSLDIFQHLPGRYVEAATLGNLGTVAQNNGDFERAHDYLRQSLNIAQDLEDRHSKAEAFAALGLLARHEGRHETAIEYTERAQELFREFGNRYGEAKVHSIRGLIATDRSEFELARESYEQALDGFQAINARHGEATTLSELSVLDRMEGRVRDARERLERAINMFQQLGDSLATAECEGILGSIELLDGDVEQGRRRFAEVMDEVDDIDAWLTQVRVIRHHMSIEREIGSADRIIDLYKIAQSCTDAAESELGYEAELVDDMYEQVTSGHAVETE
jgi:tetratricopeptide (TPR) repeat protein